MKRRQQVEASWLQISYQTGNWTAAVSLSDPSPTEPQLREQEARIYI